MNATTSKAHVELTKGVHSRIDGIDDLTNNPEPERDYIFDRTLEENANAANISVWPGGRTSSARGGSRGSCQRNLAVNILIEAKIDQQNRVEHVDNLYTLVGEILNLFEPHEDDSGDEQPGWKHDATGAAWSATEVHEPDVLMLDAGTFYTLINFTFQTWS